MKIGILTYHRVINDGSVMQAYCGLKSIQNLFPGSHVEIIDYHPSKLRFTEYRKLLSKKPPFINLKALDKISSTNQFVNQYLVLSSKCCVSNKLKEAVRFIDSQNYSAIFVGSDTVWEARRSSYVPFPPNIYYLPSLKKVKKFSFAASADPISEEFIKNKTIMSSLKPLVSDFDYITIRDEATADYLLQIGISQSRINYLPDPTLQQDINNLVQIPDIDKTKPIAGVGLGFKFKRHVIPQLKKLGYDIIDLKKLTINGRKIPGASKSLNIRLGIFALLNLLVTDRFHSCIFTIKQTNAPIVFVEKVSKWPSPNSKGRDLFRRLGIEKMVWRYDENESLQDHRIAYYLNIWKKIQINRIELLDKFITKSQNQLENLKKEFFPPN